MSDDIQQSLFFIVPSKPQSVGWRQAGIRIYDRTVPKKPPSSSIQAQPNANRAKARHQLQALKPRETLKCGGAGGWLEGLARCK